MSKHNAIRILYIEDDRGQAQLFKRKLERAGYAVDLADDGQVGLAMYQATQYEVIAIDRDLPVYDGLTLLRIMASQQVGAAIIMVTGAGDESTAVEAMKLGANDYIVKDTAGAYLNLLPFVIERVVWQQRLLDEQKRALSALNESEERFRTLTETASDGIIIIDQAGMIVFANQAVGKILGYDVEEMMEQSLSLVVPEKLWPQYSTALEEYMTLNQKKLPIGGALELRGRCKDDREILLEVSLGEFVAQGKRFFSGVFRDVTDRKQAEELLRRAYDEMEERVRERTAKLYASNLKLKEEISKRQKVEQEIRQLNIDLEKRVAKRTTQLKAANQELEAFSYSISHDLRTPLRAIKGMIRILAAKYTLPREANRYFEMIQDYTRQMDLLIEGLLEFSRLERQALRKQAIAPTNLVRQILSDLTHEMNARPVDVALAELPVCQADPLLLKQVFVNLLTNALKFTQKRTEARIEINYQQRNGHSPIYYVKDNGVGFDMNYVDKLFTVFQRLHSADDYEGTGVGLATVQRIIQRHGGRIWVEAAIDEGATFYFTLS